MLWACWQQSLHLFHDLGFGGICILFDEAESMVSFTRSSRREKAGSQLDAARQIRRLVGRSLFHLCNEPSFAETYASRTEFHPRKADRRVLEIPPLDPDEAANLVQNIVHVYREQYGDVIPPSKIQAILKRSVDLAIPNKSNVIRSIVGALDEIRTQARRD